MKVFDSLDSFNKEYVKPKMAPIEELRISLEQGRYKGFSINSWIEENASELVNYLNMKAGNPLEEHFVDVDNFHIDIIEGISDLTVDSVHELVENLAVIEISFQAYVSLQFFVHGYGFEEITKSLDLSVSDYRDYGARLEGYTKMPMELSLTFDLDEEEVEDFSVGFREIYGFCPFCGEPITHDAAESCYSCGKSFF